MKTNMLFPNIFVTPKYPIWKTLYIRSLHTREYSYYID